MSDKQQMPQPTSGCEKSRYGGHENGLINSVVRNVVVNVESVLSDLQGIMGEITTIVEHIDNVTNKMEKNGRIKKESTTQKPHNNYLRKYPWETGPKYTTDSENNFYNTQMDAVQHYQPQHDNSIHNILKVNGFSRAQTLSLSDDQQLQPPVKGTAFPFSKDSQSGVFSFFPKSFSNLPKDGIRPISQAGVIAIVHPTVINNTAVQSIHHGKDALHREMFDDSFKSVYREERTDNSTWQRSNCDDVHSNQMLDLLPQTCPPESDHVQGKQKKTQQTEGAVDILSGCAKPVVSPKRQTEGAVGILSGCAKPVVSPKRQTEGAVDILSGCAKPVMSPKRQTEGAVDILSGCAKPVVSPKRQTEGAVDILSGCAKHVVSPKRPTAIGGKSNEVFHTRLTIGSHEDYGTGDESNGRSTPDFPKEISATVLARPTHFQSLTESKTTFKAHKLQESVFESSMDRKQNNRLLLDKESSDGTNSFQLKYSSVKSVYTSVQVAPVSSGTHDSSLQPEFQSCYDSTESDLNVEVPENRCATPAIDYSYLSLVGNNGVLDDSLESLALNGSHQIHKTHVDCAHKHEQGHQDEADHEVTCSEVSTPSQSSVDISRFGSPARLSQDVLKSPIWTHVYCGEVTAGKPGEYCGCYEQVVDSVLENLTGFDFHEDTPEDVDCTAALNKTYVIFENEYEEDDWGLGLKLTGQHEYQPFSVEVRDAGGQGCASLKIVDSNMNVLADDSQRNKLNVLANNPTGCVATENREECRNIVQQRQETGILSTVEAMSLVNESLRLSNTLGEFISTEKHEDRLPEISTQQQTFNVQPNQVYNLQKNKIFNIRPNQSLNVGPILTPNVRTNQTLNIRPNQTPNVRPNSFKLSLPTLWNGRMANADQAKLTTHTPGATDYLLDGRESPMSLCSLEAASETVSLSESDSWLASSDDSRSVSSESPFKPSMSVHKARMKKLRREFFKSMYTATKVEREVGKEIGLVSNQSIFLDNNWCMTDTSRETLSESGSYQEALTTYNRNINPWTAYALGHTDDMSDSSSDIFNTTSCSITSSPDGDNDDFALEAQV